MLNIKEKLIVDIVGYKINLADCNCTHRGQGRNIILDLRFVIEKGEEEEENETPQGDENDEENKESAEGEADRSLNILGF